MGQLSHGTWGNRRSSVLQAISGPPGCFPYGSCSTHFPFLDAAGCATCTSLYSAADLPTSNVVRFRRRPPPRGRTSGDCHTESGGVLRHFVVKLPHYPW